MVGAGFMGRGIARQILNYTSGMELAAISNRHIDGAGQAYEEAGVEEVETVTSAGQLEKDLEAAATDIEKRDKVISHQQRHVEELKKDLKESVLKTRELRAELSNRAEESVRSEAKLREVETELSVAQASTDMIATGVLDYSLAPDKEDDDEAPAAGVSGTAS